MVAFDMVDCISAAAVPAVAVACCLIADSSSRNDSLAWSNVQLSRGCCVGDEDFALVSICTGEDKRRRLWGPDEVVGPEAPPRSTSCFVAFADADSVSGVLDSGLALWLAIFSGGSEEAVDGTSAGLAAGRAARNI